MLNKPSTRVLVSLVAMVALLMLTATMAGIHHHQNTTETNCPICHLNHQPIEKPLASARVPVLAPVAPSIEPQIPHFAPSPVCPRIPGRAPPLA